VVARDTSPEAAALQIEIHRRMTPAQRLRAAIEMSEFARNLTRAGLRARYPGHTEGEIEAELLKRLYGFDRELK
jgi:hypothetical protein